jgi:hypothetical protein
MTPDDARDLQIHHHIERAVNVLSSMRGVPKRDLYSSMLRYMRGDGSLSLSYAIASAFKAICESPSIQPPVSMEDLFERVECFIENDPDASSLPSPDLKSGECAAPS